MGRGPVILMRRASVVAVALVLLAPLPGALAQVDSGGHVKNQAPKIIPGHVPDEITPVAGGMVNITVPFKARDPNGWQDILQAELVVMAKDNATLHTTATEIDPGPGGNGASRYFNATFEMAYHHAPATGNESYVIRLRVQDQQAAWSDPVYIPFHYQELAATSLSAESLDFGGTEAAPGETSTPEELVVKNLGNVEIAVEVSGVPLTNGDGYALPNDSVQYDPNDDVFDDAHGVPPEPTLIEGLTIIPGADSQVSIYWRLSLPSGSDTYVPAGTYHGSIDVSAVAA